MATIYDRISSAISTLGKRPRIDDGGGNSDVHHRSLKHQHVLPVSPFDQSALHNRLLTFKPLNWFSKPEACSAIECACRGWQNEDRDCLSCVFCRVKLIYPRDVRVEHREQAARLFSEQMVTRHASHCPWRKTKCQPSLLKHQWAEKAAADDGGELSRYNARVLRLMAVDFLPDVPASLIQLVYSAHPSAFRAVVLAASGISSIQASASASAPPAKLSLGQKARMLALLGWDLEILNDGGSPDPTGSDGGIGIPPSDSSSSSYSLLHLGVKRRDAASSHPAPAPGPPRKRISSAAAALCCSHCRGKVGLWSFSGPRPAPVGRVVAAPGGLLAGRATSAGGGLVDGGNVSTLLSSEGSDPKRDLRGGAAVKSTSESLREVPALTPISLVKTIAGGSYTGRGGVSAGGGGGASSIAYTLASTGPFGKKTSGSVFGCNAAAARAAERQVETDVGTSAAARPVPDGAILPNGHSAPLSAPLETYTVRPFTRSASGTSTATGDRITNPSPTTSPSLLSSGGIVGMVSGRTPWGGRSPSPTTAAAAGVSLLASRAAESLSPPGRRHTSYQLEAFDALAYHRPWCPCVYVDTSRHPHDEIAAGSPSGTADERPGDPSQARLKEESGWMWLLGQAGNTAGGVDKPDSTGGQLSSLAAGGGGDVSMEAADGGAVEGKDINGLVSGIWEVLRRR